MAMFSRGGSYLQQRLTKLYSDTKQSYASANVTPATTNISEEPEVAAARRDFQIQHDRLLAWGYHWTDTKAAEAQYSGNGDLEIDKKLDQAGYGDVVANVMSEIQKLLDESGKLQHPERYSRQLRSSSKVPQSPATTRKDWTTHEVTTARTLLMQLTTCIDVLYNLSETRRTLSHSEKWDSKQTLIESSTTGSDQKALSEAIDPKASRKRAREDDEHMPATGTLDHTALCIPLAHITFLPCSEAHSQDPPPYEEVSFTSQERRVATLWPSGSPVLLSFVSLRQADEGLASQINLRQIQTLMNSLEQLSNRTELSHNAHLALLGYTIDTTRSRVALVYQLDRQRLEAPEQRTLAAFISSPHSSTEPSSPSLENRFRLAYNIALSLLGHFSQHSRHGSLNASNIMYLYNSFQDVSPRLWEGIRSPVVATSTRRVLLTPPDQEHQSEQIYRHPYDNNSLTEICDNASYDIYSLGLVFLEIGLWVPLAKLWKQKYDRRSFMNKIKTVYVRNLASKCGSKYMRVVQQCLSAPAELESEGCPSRSDKFTAAIAFLLRVANELRTCCALDDVGPPPPSDLEYFTALASTPTSTSHATDHQSYEIQDSSMLDAPPTPMSLPDSDDVPAPAISGTTSTAKADKAGASPALRKWPAIDIPQEDLNDWNTQLMPRLSKLLQNALNKSPESCSVSLMMIGTTPETARTTICIQCQDTSRVQAALRQRFRPKAGWGVVVLRGEVRRSGRRRKVKKGQQKQEAAALAQNKKLREQYYQERPSCGASIGAFKDGEHLPPVSFGGTIFVDGQPFGMTVHHMLDDVSDDEEDVEAPQTSMASRGQSYDLSQLEGNEMLFPPGHESYANLPDEMDVSDVDDSDSDASTIRPDYSAFDAEGNEFWFLDDAPDGEPGLEDDVESESWSSGEDDEDTASVGDQVGVDPLDDDDFRITQPAIDDVDEDFFPSAEDRDDDHLDSHSFGHVHASSGIRRVVSNDMKHEVDWALIKIHETRLQLGNMIKPVSGRKRRSTRASTSTSRDTRQQEPILRGVALAKDLAGTEVYCCGRSSGFRKGRISQAMTMVKLHGRQSFSSSWTVEGGFGVPGDSGAWIYDPAKGQLCGHVLAWGDKSKTAYIALMEVMFEDIKKTLGAEVVCLTEAKYKDSRKSETNQQLQNSKDIELALQGLAIGGDEAMLRARMERPRTNPRKDLPRVTTNSVCLGMGTAQAGS